MLADKKTGTCRLLLPNGQYQMIDTSHLGVYKRYDVFFSRFQFNAQIHDPTISTITCDVKKTTNKKTPETSDTVCKYEISYAVACEAGQRLEKEEDLEILLCINIRTCQFQFKHIYSIKYIYKKYIHNHNTSRTAYINTFPCWSLHPTIFQNYKFYFQICRYSYRVGRVGQQLSFSKTEILQR